jgi:hypothetical protein
VQVSEHVANVTEAQRECSMLLNIWGHVIEYEEENVFDETESRFY